jgi:hypothetical protein
MEYRIRCGCRDRVPKNKHKNMVLVLGLLLEAMKPMGHHPLKEVDETQYK